MRPSLGPGQWTNPYAEPRERPLVQPQCCQPYLPCGTLSLSGKQELQVGPALRKVEAELGFETTKHGPSFLQTVFVCDNFQLCEGTEILYFIQANLDGVTGPVELEGLSAFAHN